MLKVIKKHKALFLIIVLAALLRILLLNYSPPSLNWDEVSHGYNAYSILRTGKDEWGKTFPLIFKAYGDNKLPVYIYLTSIPVAIFGLNIFSVRITSVLAGVITVYFTYLLTGELLKGNYKKKDIRNASLLSAFLVAIEPWSFFLSRAAFEANLALTFFVSGVYFFLRSLRKVKYLKLSIFLLGLSVWTYNSYRIFTPLMILGLLVFYKDEISLLIRKHKRDVVISILIGAVLFIPMFYQLVKPVGQARYEWVAILDEGAIAKINMMRNSSAYSPFISRIFYNKFTYFIPQFFKNWVSHYTLEFLYKNGGDNYQFNIPFNGLLHFTGLPFILYGLYVLLKKKKKSLYFVLLWFLLAAVPSALTREAPHTLRAITMLPVPMVITAIGFTRFINRYVKGKTRVLYSYLLYILATLVLLSVYLQNYYGRYRKNYSWTWQYGNRQMVNQVKDNYDSYDNIVITKKYGEPHEFILFHWPWKPDSYLKDKDLVRYQQSNWYWVDRFDKFFFVNDWDLPETGEEFVTESGLKLNCEDIKCLAVVSEKNIPFGWKKIDTIYFLDGSVAFEIYKNK